MADQTFTLFLLIKKPAKTYYLLYYISYCKPKAILIKGVEYLARPDFKKMAAISSLALILPSSIAVGLAIGYLLDRWFKTEPYMLLIWLLFGIISGLMSLFRGIKKYLKENELAEGNERAGK
jgi:ATP synthase protein I